MDTTPLTSFLAEPRNVVVAGLRRDGRPAMTPNWFFWDGERFYVSTMRNRAKYAIFMRDPRVQLLVDDATGHRSVLVDGTAEIWEDHRKGLPYFRAVRTKYGRPVPDDDEALLENLRQEDRVLLVVTPERPVEGWTTWGLD